MTRTELYNTIFEVINNFDSKRFHEIVEKIWGQPFDGETEKIKPVTEESSATLSESFADMTIYTRSYPVILPNPNPTNKLTNQ